MFEILCHIAFDQFIIVAVVERSCWQHHTLSLQELHKFCSRSSESASESKAFTSQTDLFMVLRRHVGIKLLMRAQKLTIHPLLTLDSSYTPIFLCVIRSLNWLKVESAYFPAKFVSILFWGKLCKHSSPFNTILCDWHLIWCKMST